MSTSLAPLQIRAALCRSYDARWSTPHEHGPDGWHFLLAEPARSVIVSCADHDDFGDPAEWVHASVAGLQELPTYEELERLHAAVFGHGYAYQVFAPPAQHVNIHPFALHLWGRLDGKPALPEFGAEGSI